MALDRDRIERKDFTITRRGYDPGEVDAHLAAVANEVEDLRRSMRPSSETSAATASEQVRAIVEATETRAAGRRHRPDTVPGPVRGDIGEGSNTVPAMLGALEAVQRELTALIDSLRSGEVPNAAGLQALESNLRDARHAGPASPHLEPAPATPSSPRMQEADGQFADEVTPQAAPEKVRGDALAGERDNARLIALNMALNGAPRDETERYLAENYELADRRGLVDEVYASVEE